MRLRLLLLCCGLILAIWRFGSFLPGTNHADTKFVYDFRNQNTPLPLIKMSAPHVPAVVSHPQAPSLPPAVKDPVQVAEKWIKSIAENLYELDQDFEARDRQIAELVSKLSTRELRKLGRSYFENQMSTDEVKVYLHFLKLAGAQAAPVLAQIFVHPIPDQASEAQWQQQKVFRLMALENLDRLSIQDSRARQEVLRLADQEVVPDLRTYLQISIQGVKQNRPGKLGRFFELTLQGES